MKMCDNKKPIMIEVPPARILGEVVAVNPHAGIREEGAILKQARENRESQTFIQVECRSELAACFATLSMESVPGIKQVEQAAAKEPSDWRRGVAPTVVSHDGKGDEVSL